jgi:CRISPR/Cas system-associated exonuclease Cas4 (RecB family)
MPTPKVIPIKPVTAWSFSRWNEYETCPAKFKYKNVLKMKEPSNPAMERGTAIHKLAEDYVKGVLKRLPVELKLFKDEFATLKKEKVKYVEENWTFKKDWTPTTWNDWLNAWLRAKLDVMVVHDTIGTPIDHKTGRYQERKNAEYELQLELYGLVVLKRMPELTEVRPQLWYLDEGKIYPEDEPIVYTREDEVRLDKLWRGRIKKMMSDSTYKPKPGSACTYCHFSKSRGGQCAY